MRTSIARGRHRLAKIALTAGLVGGSLVTGATGAGAQTNPYERGPAPTNSSIEATRGAFSISQRSVSSSAANGFGGGTIWYPNDTSQGTFGAVAIAPGFTEGESAIQWLGPRLASQGFVVITIATNSGFDFPDSRATQLQAALDHLEGDSVVSGRIDPDRTAVMGHSMGGGGTLRAAQRNPDIQAAIPLLGWHSNNNWSGVRVPTLVIGAENDNVAAVNSHSIPFYESLPSSLDKAYLELRGANHFVTNSPNTTTAKYSISWLKRFVDNDTRYDQFLCPNPSGTAISDYRSTCPYGNGGTPPDDDCEWWEWWC